MLNVVCRSIANGSEYLLDPRVRLLRNWRRPEHDDGKAFAMDSSREDGL